VSQEERFREDEVFRAAFWDWILRWYGVSYYVWARYQTEIEQEIIDEGSMT